ncbi:hypothetical protein L596_010508 [Steinernema carpocapsae]|uniref:Uncharacterized protein n=1 Tax=Steinernema carpocapsae TaxID=34508 RepID=A0A4U5PIU8_STECR|nr:hypothetical protein L596_010508 [Steinernema carpocapsae]
MMIAGRPWLEAAKFYMEKVEMYRLAIEQTLREEWWYAIADECSKNFQIGKQVIPTFPGSSSTAFNVSYKIP